MMTIDENRCFVQEINERRWSLEEKIKDLSFSRWAIYRKFQDIFNVDVYNPTNSSKEVQELRLFFIEQFRAHK